MTKRIVNLQMSDGEEVRIVLENWGSGLDDILRRCTWEDATGGAQTAAS